MQDKITTNKYVTPACYMTDVYMKHQLMDVQIKKFTCSIPLKGMLTNLLFWMIEKFVWNRINYIFQTQQ